MRRARVPRAGLRLVAALGIVALASAGGAGEAQELGVRPHDASQPIEIKADKLELQQDNKVAIFNGNVVATQGDLRLRADTLRVHYRDGADEAEGDNVTIVRIDAVGNVFISSRTETAEGKMGVYDVESRVITLTGAVVLTQGEHVIRGDRVVLDLSTGRSRMEGGAATGRHERVRALFVPPKKQPLE